MNPDLSKPPLILYVDVEDTLIRTIGSKRILITAAIEHVRTRHANGEANAG